VRVAARRRDLDAGKPKAVEASVPLGEEDPAGEARKPLLEPERGGN
jgi:hypothetical protein